MLDVKESSLWANRKCLFICCIVSIANMQYGFDTAAVGGMQGNLSQWHLSLLVHFVYLS